MAPILNSLLAALPRRFVKPSQKSPTSFEAGPQS